MLVLLLHIHNPHTHCLCCYVRLFCSVGRGGYACFVVAHTQPTHALFVLL